MKCFPRGLYPALAEDASMQKQLSRHLRQVRVSLSDSIFWYAGYTRLLVAGQR